MNKTFLMLLCCSFLTTGTMTAQSKIHYPDARRDTVTDFYFGTRVAEPYRWLEDDNSDETARWVEAENKVTQDYLKRIPFRNDVKRRITELANYEKMGAPIIEGNYLYYFYNSGLQNQSVLYRRGLNADPSTQEMVLDPNTLSDDGTVALQSINFSKSGRYLAYTITRSGSDWNEIYVKDLSTGKMLDDHIVWAKFTDAQWLGDEGFFYSAYNAPEDAKSSKNEFHKACFHKLGTSQDADYVEFASQTEPLMFHQVAVSNDQRFLFVYKSEGDGNALFVKDLNERNPHYVCLASNLKYTNTPVGVDNGKIYVVTNNGAPNCKVLAYDAENLSPDNVSEFIPEKEWVLSDVSMTNHQFILTYDKDAASHAYLYDKQGKEVCEIELPTFGSVGFSTKWNRPEVFYRFTSYTFPPTVYSFDASSRKSEVWFAPKLKLNPDSYVTEQVFYPSADGTRIPMFLIYKKGMKRDGARPVFLYGYGGFNISMTPGFSYSRTPFAMIEAGGICAYTNLRGGGEYGEKWHEAGTKLEKQNVFDDFIAAAEYLIREGYTCKGKIACNGASNGGLLVGAVVNQRPDLFGAAVPQVGVMDMLRYHLFTIGWNWAHDYGRSDDNEEMFRYLLGYSPLHNVKNDGTPYPAIMVTTGDHDDRVVPAHSFKYAATLQASNTGNAVKLIRIDSKAGHGHSKPISKIIDEYTDIQSFIMYNLGVKYKYKK